MTYLQARNKPAERRARLIAAVAVVIVVVVAAVNFAAPRFIPGLAMSIAQPYWRTGFSIQSGALGSVEGLMKQNDDLKNQLAQNSVELAAASAIQAENDELKVLLGRASSTPYMLAAVLARPPYAGYDRLIIDVGGDQGRAVGDTVYAPGNVPIGTISEVLSQTSKVTLFSSPGRTYPVLIGPTHSPATAVGRGGGQYQAELPRDIKVAEGDPVLAPSLSDRPFGIVASVLSDPARPFETVLFAPPVNVYQLRWVLVQK